MIRAPKLRELGDEPLRPDRLRVECDRTIAAQQAPGRAAGGRPPRAEQGILWVLRDGAPWRDLPEHYGPYTSCSNRWRKNGVWDRVMDAIAEAYDGNIQMIDSSSVRVYQHAAGKKRGPGRCMGRSRGGLTTKIHAVVDASGLPLRHALSPGQAADSTLAVPLLDDQLLPDSFVLGDKAYDAVWIRTMVEEQDAVPIIPDRCNSNAPHAFSSVLNCMHNRVERFFNKLKQFRRIATRYEKLAANYLAMIKITTVRIWLRLYEPAA